MNIITGETNVPHYTKIEFKLWSTELKEELESAETEFGNQKAVFEEWHQRFGPVFLLNHRKGFTQVGGES